ncbi:MAG: lipopolysaccharide biosynthesis protein [Eubacteriaceae bacterium]
MRTEKTIFNMFSDIIPFFIMGLLGFIKIRVFINYLGKDFYGFTQLFHQIFGYLNLAEAGFGTAIIYSLYKPISQNDREKINRLLSGAKVIFRRIGIYILIVGFVLSFFVDIIVKNNPVSQLYTQIAFIIFLINSTGNYFIFAPRFLLQADQNKYRINLVTNIARFLQILTEIILLILGFDLLVIFTSYLFFMIISNIIINKITYKKYPWINTNYNPDLSTFQNTKHVMMHKIGSIVSLNTDNIILSSFVGIEIVGIYASYNYIIQFIITITTKIINSTQESFGNFFALKDKKESLDTFWEMNSLLFYIGSIIFTVTYISINDFIRLWVGKDMLVSSLTVLLFCIIFFYRIVRGSTIVIINGVGAFKETKWQALIEGIINLVLSIILVSNYGINGVLIATIISYLLTGFWFVPNYIFKNIFNEKLILFYMNYLINIVILLIILLLSQGISIGLGFYLNNENLIQWFVDSTIFTCIVSVIYFFVYYTIYKHYRMFLQRVIKLIRKRRNNV